MKKMLEQLAGCYSNSYSERRQPADTFNSPPALPPLYSMPSSVHQLLFSFLDASGNNLFNIESSFL